MHHDPAGLTRITITVLKRGTKAHTHEKVFFFANAKIQIIKSICMLQAGRPPARDPSSYFIFHPPSSTILRPFPSFCSSMHTHIHKYSQKVDAVTLGKNSQKQIYIEQGI